MLQGLFVYHYVSDAIDVGVNMAPSQAGGVYQPIPPQMATPATLWHPLMGTHLGVLGVPLWRLSYPSAQPF